VQCVAVCCSVLQCAAVCCSVLQCAAVCCSVLQCAAVCCYVLLFVLQCVAASCLRNVVAVCFYVWSRCTALKLTLAGKKFGHPAGMQKINLENVR